MFRVKMLPILPRTTMFQKCSGLIKSHMVCNCREEGGMGTVGLTRQLQVVDYIKQYGQLCMELLTELYDKICCEARPSYPVPYSFDFGNQEDLAVNYRKFQSNQIKTTKYNLLNFIPKSIISQYKRLANLYFLIIAIISSVPNITPLNPALIWLPLIAVLFISIIKEAVEDYQRHKMDAEINHLYQVSVLRDGVEGKVSWKDLRVGEICHIYDGETVPADLFLISSSNQDGSAFIETASLDGEKTSKARHAFPQLNALRSAQNFERFSGSFWGRAPNQSLDDFKGDIIYSDRSKIQITDNRQLLFRGSKLKNTASVWGLVVYTGQCTKIMMNSQNFKTKISNVEKKLNYMLVFLLIIQILLCITIASLAMVRQDKLNDDHSYINWGKKRSQGKMFVSYFFMYFIDFSSLIPISLIVSIEIIKLAQSYFIDFDKLMFSKEKDRGVLAKCAALNEELGQVEYVFTDKTGTLTKNKMVFHTAIIGNSKYQFRYDEDSKTYQCKDLQDQLQSLVPEPLEEQLALDDGRDKLIIETQEDLIHHYLFCLLVCNHVTTVGTQQALVYESESPDELALINVAKKMGYTFIKRQKSEVCVSIFKEKHRIKILQVFPFTSERKRMSVMVEWQDRILMYTKGADNVISQRMNLSRYSIQSEISNISKLGLRTLMVAMKVINKDEYVRYRKRLQESTHANRQSLKEEYAHLFEQNLELVGATGLLDELQEGVPETLKDMQRAKIKVWMLTGDKFETAYEVAKSCKLIEPLYEVIECKSNQVPIKRYIDAWEYQFQDKKSIKYSLVIQGSRLAQIMNDDELTKQFVTICTHFQTVVCCRMLPIQKAEVVKLIRTNLKKVCLSIGDGGNDVSMIKQANIGIGIYGEEGMNAVQASDYAIPEFRMIWRLLFVHGRWNYIRISQMILYFTYKSILFTVPRIIFSFLCGFSGQPIYDDYYIALYNVLFTSVPLIVRALFDQDINYIYKKTQKAAAVANIQKDKSHQSLKQSEYLSPEYGINNMFRKLFPKAYFIGQKNQIFNITNCLLWVIESIIISAMSTLIIIYVIGARTISRNGHNSDLWIVSVSVYSSIIVIATLKLAIHVRHWTLLIAFSIIFCSLGPYLSYVWLSNFFFSRYRIQGTIIMSFRTGATYLAIVLVSCLMVMINSIIIYSRFHKNKLTRRMQIIMKEVESQRKGDSVIEEDLMSDQYIHRSRRSMKERREDLEIEMKVVQIRFKEQEKEAREV